MQEDRGQDHARGKGIEPVGMLARPFFLPDQESDAQAGGQARDISKDNDTGGCAQKMDTPSFLVSGSSLLLARWPDLPAFPNASELNSSKHRRLKQLSRPPPPAYPGRLIRTLPPPSGSSIAKVGMAKPERLRLSSWTIRCPHSTEVRKWR